jgi:hypothetical protein
LDIRIQWNGNHHPETLAIQHNLAELYLVWGKKELATEIMNSNVKIMHEEIKNS